jgi:hypothetical protein
LLLMAVPFRISNGVVVPVDGAMILIAPLVFKYSGMKFAAQLPAVALNQLPTGSVATSAARVALALVVGM